MEVVASVQLCLYQAPVSVKDIAKVLRNEYRHAISSFALE
jgi:hypothetical protein